MMQDPESGRQIPAYNYDYTFYNYFQQREKDLAEAEYEPDMLFPAICNKSDSNVRDMMHTVVVHAPPLKLPAAKELPKVFPVK